nr:hypothetical protein [Tanacetum cinerariifolium]
MDINIDALYNILKQNKGDVNDAMGFKKKPIVVTSDPLALIAEKTKSVIDCQLMNMGQDRQMQMVGGNGGTESQCLECWKPEWLNGCSKEWKSESEWEWTFLLETALSGEGEGMLLSLDTAVDCPEGRGRNPTSSRRQASSSSTQTDSTLVYDSDGSAEVHENCDDNEIFNMFTQEEQYTELLEPIPEPQHVPQNDNNVISEVTDVEQDGETVEQHSIKFEETRALYKSLYQNLAVEVEKVNSVNRKLKETNADLTTELASETMFKKLKRSNDRF